MNFQNIEYFIAVVEHGNFTKAARSLYISQQSLSENIKRLEEEVGVPLLVRGKTITPTKAGECFLSGGRKILSTQDKMLREIDVISNSYRTRLVLGVPASDIPPMLPQAISVFSGKYPDCEVSLQREPSPEIPDLAFRFDVQEKDTNRIVLIDKEPFDIVIPDTLGRQIYGQEWDEICDQICLDGDLLRMGSLPLLLLYENKNIHPALKAIFEETGVTPVEALKSEDANFLTSLCVAGSGAFIGPEDYCRRKFGALLDPQNGTHRIYRIDTAVTSSLYLTYPKAKNLNTAEKRFVKIIQNILS